MRRAVFLDRDGVLNRAIVVQNKPYPPANLAEFEVLPGAIEACAELRKAGFLLIVVTNQPDVARGTQRREVVEAINQTLLSNAPIDEIKVCYHDDGDQCTCRKPLPGLLMEAAKDWQIDLSSSFMIGDRWKDIESGRRAGCKTILVDGNYEEMLESTPDHRVRSLAEARDWIMNHLSTSKQKEFKVKPVSDLRVKLFADGADKAGMLEMYSKSFIKGFTTNPTLMRKAGVNNYVEFALEILRAIPDRPISFEVFSDEFAEMESQARVISSWGPNVYVKIPVSNTRRQPSYDLVHRLSHTGIQINVTAVMTLEQVHEVAAAVKGGAPSCVSVFAGRIADTGRDPLPIMTDALDLLKDSPEAELIWASPRELINIFQADAIGCHIITVTNDVLKKLQFIGKDLKDFSLETVKMFRRDAMLAGYRIKIE